MAVRGAEEKQIIQDKIFEIFPNAFMDGKIIRVPLNGLEIKVTLTAAKDVLGGSVSESAEVPVADSIEVLAEPTDAEKDRVKELIETFNL